MLFRNRIIGNFTVYKDRLETFIAAIRAPTKFTMVFYRFCYYFRCQRCCYAKTSI